MEELLVALGLVFAAFLILAAAVESILEIFRGTLDWLGIGWFRSSVALDDALAEADAFADENNQLRARAQALLLAAGQLRGVSKEKLSLLKGVETHLQKAGAPFNVPVIELTKIAAWVRTSLQSQERVRIFILRTLAFVIGAVLVWLTDFYVLRTGGATNELLKKVPVLQTQGLNIVLGGLGAAAGSSYWHDQLDKIRNLKAAASGFKALVQPPAIGQGKE